MILLSPNRSLVISLMFAYKETESDCLVPWRREFVVWRRDFAGRLVALSPAEDVCSELDVLGQDLAAMRLQLAETWEQTASLLQASRRLSVEVRTLRSRGGSPNEGVDKC